MTNAYPHIVWAVDLADIFSDNIFPKSLDFPHNDVLFRLIRDNVNDKG
jgi:hypothetical protein